MYIYTINLLLFRWWLVGFDLQVNSLTSHSHWLGASSFFGLHGLRWGYTCKISPARRTRFKFQGIPSPCAQAGIINYSYRSIRCYKKPWRMGIPKASTKTVFHIVWLTDQILGSQFTFINLIHTSTTLALRQSLFALLTHYTQLIL